MRRLTAQYADQWNTFIEMPPEDVAETLAPLFAACAAAGRDPATLELSLLLSVDLPLPRQHPPSTAYGFNRADGVAAGTVLTGEPEAIADRLRAYAQAGIGHIIITLDPDTVEGIEAFAPVFDLLDGSGTETRPLMSDHNQPH